MDIEVYQTLYGSCIATTIVLLVNIKKNLKNNYLSLPFLILNENSFVQFHDVVTKSISARSFIIK